MTIHAGTRLGRYQIHSLIGTGGMGEVYLAQDMQLERTVALKILPADVTSNQERMRRFIQEAKTASALNHPNILTIHEIGQADSAHFIATEFIDGVTLRESMTGGRMRLSEVLDTAMQVASALTAAHAAGIVHRDIKPENIMVRRDGYVKVLDFGLAKLMERPAADSEAATMVNTDPGVVMGTASYMSPEQARGLDLDARTDIWSLGVVIYEMMAGRVPFEGTTTGDMLGLILGERNAPPLARFAREVPSELERIVTKALMKEREERYQTVKDLGLDLKSLRRQLEIEAEIERTVPPELRAGTSETTGGAAVETVQQLPSAPTSSTQYLVGEIRRHKLGVGILLVTLLLAIAAVAYFGYFARDSSGGKEAITSIAVLRFVNVSSDPNTEYLSDGISESLINNLSQLPQLKVIARSSSFKFKGKDADPQEVAKALGVRAILMGRVVQLGDQLQISVEFVDARDGTQVWGEQYNRKATDLLAVQAEISREIAEKLRLKLTNTEQQQLAQRETANPQAYEPVLKGRFYSDKGGTEDRKKGIEYYHQAIAIDPNYALAYAYLSISYQVLINNSILDPKEYLPKAEAAARKALELDEGLAEAHWALAQIKRHVWDWAAAEREYKRAIELKSNFARAYISYANYLSLVGQHDQAIAEIKRARELDPLSTVVNTHVGYRLFFARRYDEAIEALKQTLELDQTNPLTHTVLGYTYAEKGMYREAIAAYQEAIKLGGDGPSTQIYMGAAYAKAGERERAQAILKQLETSKEYVSPGELAILYVALGEREQAFTSLEKAYAAHDLQLQYLGVDPAFDSLRSDPRFADLLRRVGLAP